MYNSYNKIRQNLFNMWLVNNIKLLGLSDRFDKPLKRLMKYFFVSLTHDLSRGLLNNQLNNLTVSPEGMPLQTVY